MYFYKLCQEHENGALSDFTKELYEACHTVIG